MVRNSTPGIPGSNERPAKRRGPSRCPESLHRRLAVTANKELFSHSAARRFEHNLARWSSIRRCGSLNSCPSELSVNECTAPSECISGTSTLEVSDDKGTGKRLDSFRVNRPAPGTISSRRWMLFASKPVVSVSRLAARPVGAHSRHFTPLGRRVIGIEFTSAVLPGPPVMTTTRFDRTVFRASRWLWASVLPVRRSHHAIACRSRSAARGLPFPPNI